MADQMFNGPKIRLLTQVDDFSRESLPIAVSQRFRGTDVAQLLEKLGSERGLPQSIRVDNVTQFTSSALDLWANANGVRLDFSRPGKPTENALIESLNGCFRQECLNQEWFLSLSDARRKVKARRMDYDEVRAHSSIGTLVPRE